MIKQIKKIFCFSTLFSSLLYGCYKPVNKENKDDQKRVDDAVGKDNNPVIEYDPLIKSDEYHQGYKKRKYSSLFPYEPHITRVLPRLDIITDDGDNNFAILPGLRFVSNVYIAKSQGLLNYNSCKISLSNCDEKYQFQHLNAKIKVRGNSTAYAPKKNFSIKFDEKISLLDLNNGSRSKKYSLNSFYFDRSFLRDSTALYLGKQVFNYDNLFSSDLTPIELYINNEYWGIYGIQESIQVNKNRISIDDIEKREPIGSFSGTDTGYVFEYDGYGKYEKQYNLKQTFTINDDYKVPLKTYSGKVVYQAQESVNMPHYFTMKSDIYSQEQLNFLSSYVGNVYKIVYEAAYNDKCFTFSSDYSEIIEKPELSPYNAINNVINIDSFVDMYILQEICCDNDLNWGSQYFQLDMSAKGDKKLAFSSMWDYDWGFGMRNTMVETNYPGDYVSSLFAAQNGTGTGVCNSWYLLLIHEDWFWDMIKEKWKLLVENGVLYNSLHYIDEAKFMYKPYIEKNTDRWPYDNSYTPYHNNRTRSFGANLDKQIEYLFSWLARRYNYLNTAFGDGTKLFTY